MQVVYSDAHRRHAPKHFLVRGTRVDNPEVPERAENLVAAARAGGHTIVAPDDFGPGPRAAVHAARHLRFLETVHARWQDHPVAGDEVVPNMHPTRNMSHYPEGVVGQAGYHMADTACPIGPNTWAAACLGANVATHAAQLVLDVANAAYGLCRPPGHHAYSDMAGGFCFLNNVAVAAHHMAATLGRVAILDIDVHHGNGTQGIFYQRGDVLFVSVHADPSAFYPFYAGYADEHGAGAGEGANLNLPLARGAGDAAFLEALERGIARVGAFVPGALVVVLGLDAFEGDPLGGLALTTEGFGRIGARLAGLGLPTVIVQEGGYLCAALGDNLTRFLGAFEAAQTAA